MLPESGVLPDSVVRPPSPLSDPTPPPSESAKVVVAAPRAPRMSLEQYALVKAALLDGANIDEPLREAGVTERAWRLEERRLAIDLTREAAAGHDRLLRRIEHAIDAARPAVVADKSDDDTMDLSFFATVAVQLGDAEDADDTLADLGLDRTRWRRAKRAWTRRALCDAAIAEELRDALASARRRFG